MVFFSSAKNQFSEVQPQIFPKSCRNTTVPQHRNVHATRSSPAAARPKTMILQRHRGDTASNRAKYTFGISNRIFLLDAIY